MADMRIEFEQWLNAGNAKKFTPSFIVANLEEVSRWAVDRDITKVGFFDIDDPKIFNRLCSKLWSNKIFNIVHKGIKAFIKTNEFYYRFLKTRAKRTEPAEALFASGSFVVAKSAKTTIAEAIVEDKSSAYEAKDDKTSEGDGIVDMANAEEPILEAGAPTTDENARVFPPFPYEVGNYEFADIIPFAQQVANYEFYCANIRRLERINLDDLELSVRTSNVLRHGGYHKISDIVFLPIHHFFSLHNMGRNSVIELVGKICIEELTQRLETVNTAIASGISGGSLPHPLGWYALTNLSVRARNTLRENDLLDEFIFLSKTDAEIYALRKVGSKTASELIAFKQNRASESKEFFVYRASKLIQAICAENNGLDLKILADWTLGKHLSDMGIRTVAELKKLESELLIGFWDVREELYSLLEELSENIITAADGQFNWLITSNSKGNKPDKAAERNIGILKSLADGFNLQITGDAFGLTRERVRQIATKKQRLFDGSFLKKPTTQAILEHLTNGLSYCSAQVIEETFAYGKVFAYFLRESTSDDVTFVKEIDSFIYGENWFKYVENFIETLPLSLERNDFDAVINPLFSILTNCGIVFNKADIAEVILSQYKQNGEFLTRVRLTLVAKYRRVIERYFAGGISVYDEAELSRFRKRYNELYDDNKVADHDRALVGRIVDCCILIGRGRYGLKKEKYISDELLDEIFQFILSHPHDIIMTNTIFAKFEERLFAEGVDNKYFLQGIIKQHNTYGLYLFRDYVSKSKEKSNIYGDIVAFIKNARRIVSVTEIREEFQSVPESVLLIVLCGDEIIPAWNKSYIHKASIDFSEQDEFLSRLQETVSKNKLISDKAAFALASDNFVEFLENNKIENSYFLFGILRAFFADKFKFARPHIIDNSIDIDKGIDLVRRHFRGRAIIKVTEIKDFLKEKDVGCYSFIELLNSLDGVLLIDKDTLIAVPEELASASIIDEIEKAIDTALGSKDYAMIADLNILPLLPNIGIEWSDWAVYSIVQKGNTAFQVTTSTNLFATAVPIILRSGTEAEFAKESIVYRGMGGQCERIVRDGSAHGDD